MDYDIAVYELETESKFPPVKIHWDNDASVAVGVAAMVRGFGGTSSSSDIASPVLLDADVPITDNLDC